MKTTKARYSRTLFLLYVNVFTHFLFFFKKKDYKLYKKNGKKKPQLKKNEHIFILHFCRTDNSNCSIGDIPPIQGQ